MVFHAFPFRYGTFQDCRGCGRAMSSVMDANLLLFKTVIAGDGWGEIAVPVIEQYPSTAVIFMGLSILYDTAIMHLRSISNMYIYVYI